MYSRLIDFIDKHNILHKKQFEFQKGKSTEHAILDLNCNTVKAIEYQEKKLHIFRLCESL